MHAEYAYRHRFRKSVLQDAGTLHTRTYNACDFLIGVRYLTRGYTAWIIEYHKSQTGFSESRRKRYYALINSAYTTYQRTGRDAGMKQARRAAGSRYGRKNPMCDYLYIRASKREPFDLVYFTPSMTGIVNLNDGSFSLFPELQYVPVTNLEMRLKGGWLSGSRRSEFGERHNDYRLELRMRYFFKNFRAKVHGVCNAPRFSRVNRLAWTRLPVVWGPGGEKTCCPIRACLCPVQELVHRQTDIPDDLPQDDRR